MEGFYRRALGNSVAGHGFVLVLAVVVSLCAGWIKRKPREIPLAFTVVIEEAQEAEAKAPEPRQPRVPRDPPPPPPPPAEAVVPLEKPKETPVRPVPDPPKPQPVPETPKPKPEAEKPKPAASTFKKGERVVRNVPVAAQPVKLARQPMLSASEIERLLAEGARVGEENRIPQDEVQRCFLLVKQALYDAWARPSRADAGPRPTQVELTFGPGGVVAHVRMARPSGSAIHDQSALAACRAVGRIHGLTVRFLREYPRVTVDFELE